MKKVLFSMMAIAIALYACKKDDKGSSTNPTAKPISTDSVQLLSDSVHAINVKATTKATLPAPKQDGLVLQDRKDTVLAVNGGFAILIPQVNGAPVGYYVRIKGANTYFTTVYPAIAPPNRVGQHKAGAAKGLLARMQNAGGDHSTIGLKLPLNLLPGTFTVEYEAYDTLGNISNVATSIVRVVTNDQTTTDFKALAGKWNEQWEYTQNSKGDTTEKWNPMAPDSSIGLFTCVDNALQYSPQSGDISLNWWLDLTTESSLQFTTGNTAKQNYVGTEKELDQEHSHCDSVVYTTADDSYQYNYSFHYDAASKLLTFIQDEGGAPGNEYQVYSVTVTTLTANKLVLVQTNEDERYSDVFTK